jgi:hypothetical protein
MTVEKFEEDPGDREVKLKKEKQYPDTSTKMKKKLKFTVGFVSKGEFSCLVLFSRKSAMSPTCS